MRDPCEPPRGGCREAEGDRRGRFGCGDVRSRGQAAVPVDGDPVLRPAARVVLLDPDDCILLQRCVTKEGWDGWITPGGGIEAGESAFDAALRELVEEVGLRNVSLGPPIWTRRHVFTWNGVSYDQRETYFVAHLSERVEPDPTMSAEQMAHEGLDEQRWWRLEELNGVNTAPRDLVALVGEYLSSGAPPFPKEIGV